MDSQPRLWLKVVPYGMRDVINFRYEKSRKLAHFAEFKY
jgi:hypothetical protein